MKYFRLGKFVIGVLVLCCFVLFSFRSVEAIVDEDERGSERIESLLKKNRTKKDIDEIKKSVKGLDKAPDEIIVKFKAGSKDKLRSKLLSDLTIQNGETSIGSIDVLNKKFNVKRMSPVFKGLHKKLKNPNKNPSKPPRNKHRAKRIPKGAVTPDLENIYLLKIGKAENIDKIISEYKNDPNVEYAEPNYISRVCMAPDDPYYASSGSWGQNYDDLWGLKKIQAEQAWDISQGEGVVVAVVDTGLDCNHEDISDNVWKNEGEIPDDGIDNDGNGYVDDVNGWNFVDGDNSPEDGHGHGTHTAGTIAAVGNNWKGIIGVAPKAKIMPVKGLNDDGDGGSADLAECIRYAADMEADIISNSWGGEGRSITIEEAVNYAYSTGCVIVAAADNKNRDVSYYYHCPSMLSNVIAVSSTNHEDAKSDFSNYGSKIAVAAPGGDSKDDSSNRIFENILSLKAAGTDMYEDGVNIVGANYFRLRGTSMACPHVSGVLALLLSKNPSMSALEAEVRLKLSADDIVDTGKDKYSGYGRVNAYKALTLTEYPVEILLRGFSFTNVHGNTPPLRIGEKLNIYIELVNVKSGVSLENVTAVIETSDPYVTIENNTSSFGNLEPWLLTDNSTTPFLASLSENTPGEHVVDFSVKVYSNGILLDTFQIDGCAVVMTSSRPILSIDDCKGNNNTKMDAGETVRLRLAIVNDDDCIFSAKIKLGCDDTFVVVKNPIVDFGDILTDKMAFNYENPWVVNIDGTCPLGHTINLKFEIISSDKIVKTYEFVQETSSPQKTIFVDVNNTSGIENGTAEYPFVTIQKGIGAALENDNYIVWVRPGSYSGYIVMKSGVNVIGSSGSKKTIINSVGFSSHPFFKREASVLSGFMVKSSGGSNGLVAACVLIEVKDCVFQDFKKGDFSAGVRMASSNFLMWRSIGLNNKISVQMDDHARSLSPLRPSIGMCLENVFLGRDRFEIYTDITTSANILGLHSIVTLQNNYFANANNYALYFLGSNVDIKNCYIANSNTGVSSGMSVTNVTGNKIVNCAYGIRLTDDGSSINNNYFVNNTTPLIIHDCDITAKNNVFEKGLLLGASGTFVNNVFSKNAVEVFGDFKNNVFAIGSDENVMSGEKFGYNDFYEFKIGGKAIDDGTVVLEGNIYDNPQFINVAVGDYHLSNNSPCIDSGDPDPSYNDIDGTRNDIGCYGGQGGNGTWLDRSFKLELNPEGPYTLKEDETLHLQLTVNGESDVLYSAVGLPKNASLDPSSGVLEFLPPGIGDVFNGSYDIVLVARNNEGQWDAKEITIEALVGIQVNVFRVGASPTCTVSPADNVNIEAYTESGVSTGIIQNTGNDGRTLFELISDNNYKFKVNYNGYDYWSPMVSSPGVAEIYLCISLLTVLDSGKPVKGASVNTYQIYDDDGDNYYDSKLTDENGRVFSNLPGGEQFRYKILHLSNDSEHYTDVFTAPASIIFDIDPNQPPVVNLKAYPILGSVPLSVVLTAVSNEDIVKYEWDFDNNNIYDMTTFKNAVGYTYNDIGIYNPNVRVTDNEGATAKSRAQVSVVAPLSDIIPPRNISNFNVYNIGTGKQLELSWNNPSDADFMGVKILRKEGSSPVGLNDNSAITVYDENGYFYLDNSVISGVDYFYKTFAYDSCHNYASGRSGNNKPSTIEGKAVFNPAYDGYVATEYGYYGKYDDGILYWGSMNCRAFIKWDINILPLKDIRITGLEFRYVGFSRGAENDCSTIKSLETDPQITNNNTNNKLVYDDIGDGIVYLANDPIFPVKGVSMFSFAQGAVDNLSLTEKNWWGVGISGESNNACMLDSTAKTYPKLIVTFKPKSKKSMPDLKIYDIRIDGKKILYVEAKNVGKVRTPRGADIRVNIYVDGMLAWIRDLKNGINRGQTKTITIKESQTLLSGKRTIKAIIDPINKIEEEKEDNNTKERGIRFK